MDIEILIRVAIIAATAVAAHLLVLGARALGDRLLRSRVLSEAKAHTLTSFATSLLVFVIYFAALGFALDELGVALTTYLAGASVIGLAVSFGSQGVVQDVISGLTVVFSDLLDVGDMVELGGQVGIVEHVGIRFTVLVNYTGARVFVPNRFIVSVINYPKGYIRAFLDVRLPADAARWDEAEQRLRALAAAAYEQYPGTLLLPPSFEGRFETSAGFSFARVKFRIWPGQGGVLEQGVKPQAIQAMKALDERYADSGVTVHYRSEPVSPDPDKRLPRPFALALRRLEALEARRARRAEAGPEEPGS